jgi:hypothetical protein
VTIQPGLESEAITWKRLASLDEDNTRLAQRMTLRYNYEISKSDLLSDVGTNSREKETEEFGFNELGQFYFRIKRKRS